MKIKKKKNKKLNNKIKKNKMSNVVHATMDDFKDDRKTLEEKLEQIVANNKESQKLTENEEKNIEYIQAFVYSVMQLQKAYDKKILQARLEAKIKTKKTNLTAEEWDRIENEIYSRPENVGDGTVLEVLRQHMKEKYELDPQNFLHMTTIFKDKTFKEFLKLIRPAPVKKENDS